MKCAKNEFAPYIKYSDGTVSSKRSVFCFSSDHRQSRVLKVIPTSKFARLGNHRNPWQIRPMSRYELPMKYQLEKINLYVVA